MVAFAGVRRNSMSTSIEDVCLNGVWKKRKNVSVCRLSLITSAFEDYPALLWRFLERSPNRSWPRSSIHPYLQARLSVHGFASNANITMVRLQPMVGVTIQLGGEDRGKFRMDMLQAWCSEKSFDDEPDPALPEDGGEVGPIVQESGNENLIGLSGLVKLRITYDFEHNRIYPIESADEELEIL